MKRFVLTTAAALMFAQTAAGQPAPAPAPAPVPAGPPCLLETPAQRAIWDRMKAENHVGYQQIVKNTTWDRYNDLGRWELLAGLINKDPALIQKSYIELKTVLSNFTNIFAGNESREYAVELPIMWGCMYPYLDEVQRADFKNYIIKMNDGVVAILRPGDSDQATGNYMGLALSDKVLGTKYLEGTFSDGLSVRQVGGLTPTDCLQTSTLRDAVCNFAKIMGVDGSWPEGTQYNGGTLWFYMFAVQTIGVEYFPEAVPFIKAAAKFLIHEHMPGLRNRFEWGDTEHPNQMILAHGPQDVWQVLQSLLDEVGEPELAGMVRQFEVDMLAANGIKQQNPLYARYYYRHNPYGIKVPWRDWAGLDYQARGQGLSFWRTGWDATDRGTFVHTPAVSNGVVDHWGAFEFDIRAYRKGVTVIDHPLAYAPDRRFFNTVLIRDSGMSAESGGLISKAFEAGKVAYASGYNAGVANEVYEGYATPPPTFQHGQRRSVFQPLDGGSDAPDVWLVVDVIHAEDPTTLTGVGWMGAVLKLEDMYYKNVADRFRRAKPMTWYWHMPVKPTITNGKLEWTAGPTKVSVRAINTTLTHEIIDETAAHCKGLATDVPGCLGGYMGAEQLKFAVKSSTENFSEFTVVVHCLTALETGAADCQPLQSTAGAPVVGGVVTRQGLPAVSFLSSAVRGPKLTTSLNSVGRVRWEHTKGETVVGGTRVCAPFSFTAVAGDAYFADLCDGEWTVEQNGKPVASVKVQGLLRANLQAGPTVVKLNGLAPPVPDVPTPPTPPVPPVPPTPPVPPVTCVPSVEVVLLSSTAGAATWQTAITNKEKQGYTFIGAASGKAMFRKNCPTPSALGPLGSANPTVKSSDDATEYQRLRRERLAIEADLKGKR